MRQITAFVLSLLFSLVALAGAWGEGSFENDDAMDWVRECTRSIGAKQVVSSLNNAIKAKYLEAPDGSAAVAAAEVVAAAKGKPSAAIPKELSRWLENQSKQEMQALAPLAAQALRKVRDAKSSELKQLWAESKANNWEQRVAELEARLGS